MRYGFQALLRKSYSLPTIEIDIQNQELALRREAPQRVIFHWEGSNHSTKVLSLFREVVIQTDKIRERGEAMLSNFIWVSAVSITF